MKIFRRALAATVSLFLCLTTQVMADVPYISTGMVTLSGGNPTATLPNLAGQSTCTASSSGSGTFAIEVSQDGTTWTAATLYTPSGTSELTFTAPGTVSASVAAYPYARLHLTSGAGGTAYLACGSGPIFIASSGGGGGGNVTVTNFPNPQNVNVTQFGGATVGAATAAGTSASGNIIGIQGVTGGVPLNTNVTFPGSIAVTQSTSPWVSSIPAGLNVNNFPATQAVSGTVTANAGTGFPSTTTAGTSGTNLITIQGSPSGVAIPISGTVTTTPSGTQNVNQLQLGGATLGAATTAGTSATGNIQGIQGVAGGVALPISGSVSVSNFPATQPVSGTVTVNQGTSPWVVTTPPPFSGAVTQGTTPWTVGGSTGTLTQTANGLKVDGSAVTQPVSGTVTANAGSGTFTVAGTVTANAGTGFPSVTAAGTSGASLTTIQGSPTGVAVPISGTVTTTPSGTQNVQGLGTAGSPSGGVLTTQGQDVAVTGTLNTTTAGNTLVDTLGAGQGTVGIGVSGAWTGTVQVQASADGTNYVTVYFLNPNNGSLAQSDFSTNGQYQVNTSGFKSIQLLTTSPGTGSANITFQNTSTGGVVSLGSAIPNGLNNIGIVSIAGASNADGIAGASTGGVRDYGFNGTTWDRIRTSTVGTSIAGGSVGVLGVQGVSGGVAMGVNGTGTAGTPNAGVVTIQGIAGGTVIPVSGTVIVTPSGTQNVNQAQMNGTALGSPTSAGTSASGNIQGIQGVTGGVPVTVTSTAANPLKTVLTSASATACTNIEVSTTGTLVELVNSSSSGLTVTLNLYDEGAGPTCANADLIYSVQLGASQITLLNVPLGAGLSYSLSGALTAGGNITITRR